MEEGIRRGGKQLSRRMSELLGMFGEGGDGGMFGLTIGGTVSEESLLSLSSVPNKTLLLSIKTKIKCNIKHEETQLSFREERTLSEGCDWPVGNSPSILTTNRRTERNKRKCNGEIESERVFATKKWRGDWS